jgi:mannose-6-phosphate isomerase
VQRVEGVVHHYPWGDPAFIPQLVGVEPDGRPWAELWLGTHPNGPARLGDGTALADVTGELPYLLKVLAAAAPLSLQTHPDADQARSGYDRGIFVDPYPKPELLCALTPFSAFCGFRAIEPTLELLADLGADRLEAVVSSHGPGAALTGLYTGAIDHRPVISACDTSDRPEAEWVRHLAALHPDDPSVAVTLLLNLVVLQPGQALRFDAGNLHAYLHGAGIELMSASDNVVRGGMTSKPVDVDLLLEIVDATPIDHPALPDSTHYELPAAGVVLRRYGRGEAHVAGGHELAVDLAGGTWYLRPGERFVADEFTYVVGEI